MLRLRLKNFRAHQDLTLPIPLTGVTLLKGRSGAGKSTILQAIQWALYGNLRKVSTFDQIKKETSVEIELPQLKIMRSNKPNRLTLVIDQQTFDQQVAQSMIDRYFGTPEIWLSTCYIPQGVRNSFLGFSNNEKMAILDQIAFQEDDPAPKIEKLSRMIQEHKNTQQIALAKNEEQQKNLQTYITRYQISAQEQWPSTEEVNHWPEQLKQLEGMRERIKNDNLRRALIQSMIDGLEKNLIHDPPIKPEEPEPKAELSQIERCVNLRTQLSLMGTIKEYIAYTEDDLVDTIEKECRIREELKICTNNKLPYQREQIRDQIIKLDHLIREQPHYEAWQILQSLEDLPEIEHHVYGYTNEDLIKAIILEEKIEMERKRCRKYGLDLNASAIERRIADLEYAQLYDDQMKIRSDLDKLIIPESIELDQSLIDLKKTTEEKLAQARQAQHLLRCPKCSTSLKYDSSVGLIPYSLDPCSPKRVMDLDRSLKHLNEQIDLKSRELNLVKEKIATQTRKKEELTSKLIPDLQPPAMAPDPLQLRELKNIIVQEPPKVGSEQIRSDLKIGELVKEYERKKIEREKIIQKLATLPEPREGVPVKNIDQLVALREVLLSLTFPQIQSDSTTIRSHLAIMKQEKKRNELTKELEDLGNWSEYDLQLKKSYLQYHEEHERYIAARNGIIKQINEYREQQSLLLNQDLKPIEDMIEQITKMMERYRILQGYAELYQIYQTGFQELSKITGMIEQLEYLKQLMVLIQCQLIEQTVSGINLQLQDLLNDLFEQEMLVRLDLFRTAKSTGIERPLVNLSIEHKGGSYEKIEHLSGGEGDRVSLALTLALSKISNFPLILLDETLASLDIEHKIKLIELLQKFDRGFLVVMHDGVEGIFDHVIDIE